MGQNHMTQEQELAKEKRRQQRNLRHAHAKGLMQGILSMLDPNDIVVDCGANVGDVTVPLAHTGAQVIAFEPDPYAFEQLQTKVEDFPNVTLHNAAVGTKNGTIKLMRAVNFDDNPKGGSVKSTIVEGGRNIETQDSAQIDVQLIDFPYFIQKLIQEHGGISFIKMDIEGAELEILETMFVQDLFKNVDLTVAETHENKFRDLRPRFKKLRRNVSEAFPITKVNLDWI